MLPAAGNLAATCRLQGKYAEAAQLKEKALAAMTRGEGDEDPGTLLASGNLTLSHTHNDQGRFAEPGLAAATRRAVE